MSAMRQLAPILCAVTVVAGCQSQRAKLVTAGISAGIALPTTYAVATREGDTPVVLTATAITTGALALGALLFGLNHEDPDEPRFVQSIRMPDHRDEAWEYTKLAAAAARQGDCEAVLAYQRVVRTLDDDFHSTVFARDAAILRCLVAALPIAPAPPPPVTPAPAPATPTPAPSLLLTPAR